MGLRKIGVKNGYEEMEGKDSPVPSPQTPIITSNSGPSSLPSGDFELASVSVVPDGNYSRETEDNSILTFKFFFVSRYLHCHSSS